MAKKNYTWKLEEELVSKIQKLAEKAQSVAVGGKKNKEKNAT